MTTDWHVTVLRHGIEQHPVVVIDRFADAERFREDAATLSFRSIGAHYPGIRAPVAPAMLRNIIAALAPVVADVFDLHDLEIVDAFYSLLTRPPEQLAPIQRLPHFDEVSPRRLALLHFVAPDASSGTAFFRHRATGFEAIDAARLPHYRRALDADLTRFGVPAPGYIAGDTDIFDQVAQHQGCFNRALLYRSNTLHCAAIPPTMRLSDDPRDGRLTVNTFLEGTPTR